MLFGPTEFGHYSLAATFFQYGLIFDLGTSQMLDRHVPALIGKGQVERSDRLINELLWLRLLMVMIATLVALAALLAVGLRDYAPEGALAWTLSLSAGLLFMIGNGPASVYRARSQAREYALAILLLNGGLILARPIGAAVAGLDGCFGAMVLWYVFTSTFLQTRIPLRPAHLPRPATIFQFIGTGLPLFAAALTWAFFTSANRWFASLVTTPLALGHFAFGANILYLVVGTCGGLSAFYYPGIARRIATGTRFSCSNVIARDYLYLIVAMSLTSAIGIITVPTFVHLLYPAYEPAIRETKILLVAATPLVLAAWLMPLSLSAGRYPWFGCLGVYPAALASLGAAIFVLHGPFGEIGIAAASTVSAVMLIALQLILLWYEAILRRRDCFLLWCAALVAIAVIGCTVAIR